MLVVGSWWIWEKGKGTVLTRSIVLLPSTGPPIRTCRLARQKAEQEKAKAAATGVVEAGADGSFDVSTAAATAPAEPKKQPEKGWGGEEEEDSERNARTWFSDRL